MRRGKKKRRLCHACTPRPKETQVTQFAGKCPMDQCPTAADKNGLKCNENIQSIVSRFKKKRIEESCRREEEEEEKVYSSSFRSWGLLPRKAGPAGLMYCTSIFLPIFYSVQALLLPLGIMPSKLGNALRPSEMRDFGENGDLVR